MKIKLKIVKNDYAYPEGRWYVGADKEGFLYLHNNGVIYRGTLPNGWFKTRKAAREAVALYRKKNG